MLVYVQDGNTSDPVRAAGTNATIDTTDLEVTIGSETTDLVLAFAHSFPPTNPALSGTVFINDASLNSHNYDCSEVTAGASSTTVTMTNEHFSAMAAISLKEAASGRTTKNTRAFPLGVDIGMGRWIHG